MSKASVMKAIVIQQPWAWAIAAGYKRVENRSRRTNHRGALAIVAGKQCDPAGRALLARLAIHPPLGPDGRGEIFHTGIIAIVDLVDCVELRDSELADDPWASGPYCWILERVRRLDFPIPFRAMPGMFSVNLG